MYCSVVCLTSRLKIRTFLTSPSVAHGPVVVRCSTVMCWDSCSWDIFCCCLVLNTTKSPSCLNTETADSVERYRQRAAQKHVVCLRQIVRVNMWVFSTHRPESLVCGVFGTAQHYTSQNKFFLLRKKRKEADSMSIIRAIASQSMTRKELCHVFQSPV